MTRIEIDEATLIKCLNEATEKYFNTKCEYYGLDAETIEKQAKTIRTLRADDKAPWNNIGVHGYPKFKPGTKYLVMDIHDILYVCEYAENLRKALPLEFNKEDKGFYTRTLIDGQIDAREVTAAFWKEIKLPQKD